MCGTATSRNWLCPLLCRAAEDQHAIPFDSGLCGVASRQPVKREAVIWRGYISFAHAPQENARVNLAVVDEVTK